MWVVRELIRLVEKIIIGFAIALLLATLWALVSKGGFVHSLRYTLLIIGAFTLVMAGMGRGTPFERRLDYGITESAWGRMPGVSSLKFNPEDPTLTPGAVFVGTGVALLAFGLFVV
jgi:hypothetical protein